MLILFCTDWSAASEGGVLRTFLGQDEIPPSSLVQSEKRCLVGWAKPQMVSKNPGRERETGEGGAGRGVEGANVGLMNYTKQQR